MNNIWARGKVYNSTAHAFCFLLCSYCPLAKRLHLLAAHPAPPPEPKTPKPTKPRGPLGKWVIKTVEVEQHQMPVPDLKNNTWRHPGAEEILGNDFESVMEDERRNIVAFRKVFAFVEDMRTAGILDVFRYADVVRRGVPTVVAAMKSDLCGSVDTVNMDILLRNIGMFFSAIRMESEAATGLYCWEGSIYQTLYESTQSLKITVDGDFLADFLATKIPLTIKYVIARTGVRDATFGRSAWDYASGVRHILFHRKLLPYELACGIHPEMMHFDENVSCLSTMVKLQLAWTSDISLHRSTSINHNPMKPYISSFPSPQTSYLAYTTW